MQEITIGEMIKYLRMDKGYSKSLLCHGICSITALTRYEVCSFMVHIKEVLTELEINIEKSE